MIAANSTSETRNTASRTELVEHIPSIQLARNSQQTHSSGSHGRSAKKCTTQSSQRLSSEKEPTSFTKGKTKKVKKEDRERIASSDTDKSQVS